jgi:hypothetical protein
MTADAHSESRRAIWNGRKWLMVRAFLFPLVAAVSLIVARQQLPEAFVRPTVTDGVG